MSAAQAVATVGGAGSVAAIATVGWPAVAVVVALAMLVLVETAWVLNNMDRCHRLVMVITAVRGGRATSPTAPPLSQNPAEGDAASNVAAGARLTL